MPDLTQGGLKYTISGLAVLESYTDDSSCPRTFCPLIHCHSNNLTQGQVGLTTGGFYSSNFMSVCVCVFRMYFCVPLLPVGVRFPSPEGSLVGWLQKGPNNRLLKDDFRGSDAMKQDRRGRLIRSISKYVFPTKSPQNKQKEDNIPTCRNI